MQLQNLGSIPITVIISLVVAIILLITRILIMQRVQKFRQRENRQETERLKAMIGAYRSLAGSFGPVRAEHFSQIEETLTDIILFGTLSQVESASKHALELSKGELSDYQALVDDLRADLRIQLGLEQIPSGVYLPHSGPGRTTRNGRSDTEGNGKIGNDVRTNGAGMGGGAAAGAGGIGIGLISSDGNETTAQL